MVVCAVKLCRNYTGKNIKPPEGISFHRFPTDAHLKQAWVRAVRRAPEWTPGAHCRVCSVHFDNKHFKVSETGRRILLKDAVPTKNLYREERGDVRKKRGRRKPVSSADIDASEALACRACLATTGLCPLERCVDILQLVMDAEVSVSDGLPPWLCVVCTAFLTRVEGFRRRCHDVQDLLAEAAIQHQITTDYIKNLDRASHNLPPLTIKRLPNIDVTESDVKEESIDILLEDDNSTNDLNVDEIYDIFEDKTDPKIFETEVKIEHETENFDEEKIYGTIVPKSEIFAEANHVNKESKKRKSELKKKSKKIKKEVQKKTKKEDIRNTKPRKTDEDYEEFSKQYNVDILFLSIEEQIAEVRARRESDNYKNSRFKCELCFKGFTGESAFNNHKMIHDPSTGSYVCEPCGSRFPKRRKLLHHLTQHKMNLVCRLCSHVTKLLSKAKEHYKWHNGVKYPCHYCDKSFIKRTSQFNHMRNRHGTVSCDICHEVLSGHRGLAAHMQKAHREAVKSRCESCGVQFHSDSALNRHIDSAPENICQPELTKACAECGENFPTEELLTEHAKSNHWREIKCNKCNANFENEKLYRMHRVIHKEVRNRRPRSELSLSKVNKTKVKVKVNKQVKIQKRMCEMCGLTWRSAAALKYHQRVHTGEKPHQCPMCPKSFRIQDSLQIHMNTHTGARPFKCPHCPKAFKSRTQNHKHQLVHNKIRRYRCDLCDKTFQTSTCVKTHIRTVHMKIPAPPRARSRPLPRPADPAPSHDVYMHKMDAMEDQQ